MSHRGIHGQRQVQARNQRCRLRPICQSRSAIVDFCVTESAVISSGVASFCKLNQPHVRTGRTFRNEFSRDRPLPVVGVGRISAPD